MIVRRLYSSATARQAASRIASLSNSSPSHTPTPTQAAQPGIITRGRSKPSGSYSISTRLLAAKLSRAPTPIKPKEKETGTVQGKDNNGYFFSTRGRRRRSHRRLEQYPELNNGYTFQPIRLYPAQAELHLAYTPSHMPIPIHLGTKHYTSIPDSSSSITTSDAAENDINNFGWMESELGPFVIPPSSSPSIFSQIDTEITTTTTSAFSEHLQLISNLPSSALGNYNRDSTGATWDRVLSQMQERQPTTINVTEADQAELNNAVDGLTAMLAKIDAAGRGRNKSQRGQQRIISIVDPEGEDDWVDMTSVKRKRVKKMSKHKFKKRRKEQRALRKKLGK